MLLLVLMAAVLAWMILVFVSGLFSNWRGAPYVPTKKKLVRGLLAFGGLSAGDVFYDLGSGNGQVLISAVRDFHASRAVGYEASPWPYMLSRWKVKNIKNISVKRSNFIQADLSEATFVYAYLFPKIIDRLASKLERELWSGARVLCLSFPIDTARHSQFSLKKEAKIGSITAYLYEKI